MESKRKASGAHGVESSADDRVAKRRKLQEEFGDLTVKGETPQSTTAYGLNILESIRATTDKNGRPVSPFFERIPTKAENPDYYVKIRLPLSLGIIERKLNKLGYPTLSALESDFKRMVSNVKETYARQTEVFGDSERVRKAVSNLMVKCNPAYKNGKNYQAVPTPLPPSPGPGDNFTYSEVEEDAPGEIPGGPKATGSKATGGKSTGSKSTGGKSTGGKTTGGKSTGSKGKAQEKQKDEDAEGEDDEEPDNEDDDEDEDDDADDDDEPPPTGGKRQRPGRQISIGTPQQSRSASMSGRGLDSYEGIPYAGLTFQQAQEKILDDILRKKDAEDYHYFEPFLFLPPRTLKDYFEVIAEPCSLRGIQKQVRGQKGRKAATGVTEFKTWAAFEDQASLIWKNAYHYNEDGSEISVMAHELETLFKQLLAEAKQNVAEPPQQQKIKLKVSQNAAEKPAQTPAHTKKITIHVGGKGSAAASPAPAPAPVPSQFGDAESNRNGTPFARNPFGAPGAAPAFNPMEKARSISASGPSPSPSVPGAVKPEEFARQSPAMPAPVGAMTTQQQFVPIMQPMVAPPGAVAHPPPPPRQTAADILEAQKYRSRPIRESEALITKLVIGSHPSLQLDNRLNITIPASTTETQQELLFNAPANYFRLQLRPQVAPFLEAQQREWKLNVTHDFSRLYPSSMERRNEPAFDVNLRYGSNRLEVSLVAALPKGEKGPHGINMEMEKFVIHYNLLKHQ